MGSDDSGQKVQDSHHRKIVILTVVCSVLGGIVVLLLCLWFYHFKCSNRSAKKSVKKTPGILFLNCFHWFWPLLGLICFGV